MDISFEQTIQALTETQHKLKRSFNLLSNARLLAFLGAAGFFVAAAIGPPWLAAPGGVCLLLFIALVIKHAQVDETLRTVTRKAEIVAMYLARAEGSWDAFADDGADFALPQHPYAEDLDILGPGGLYQYLCCANTPAGRAQLAAALLDEPRPLAQIAARQLAVQELAGNFEFCVNLQAAGASPGEYAATGRLLAYMQQQKAGKLPPRPVLYILSATFVLGAVLGALGLLPFWVPALLFVALAGFAAYGYIKCGPVLGPLGGIKRSLAAYRRQIDTLQGHTPAAPLLSEQHSLLTATQGGVLTALKQLDTIAAAVEFRSSGLLHFVVNLLTLWDLHCAAALEKWRAANSAHLPAWLDALGVYEMCASLAVPAQVRAEYSFPQLLPNGMVLKGQALSHPLIPAKDVVANNIDCSDMILLVTGSNMSGKTTLLRTVGTSLVLAWAGAPVAAQSFTCSPLHLYTSMRNADDLSKGVSTFYAELLRIKTIVQQAKTGRPLLFLLDEIFKGTNSADRIAGAKAVIANLSAANCIGLVSTHDLELCVLEEENARVHNFHFEEQYAGDEIHFDYRMRPGRSTTTNARHLMRLAGISLPPQ